MDQPGSSQQASERQPALTDTHADRLGHGREPTADFDRQASRPATASVPDAKRPLQVPDLERSALLWLLQAVPISMLRFWSGSDAGVDASQALEAMTNRRVAALTAANYFRTNSTMTQAMLAVLVAVHVAAGAAFFLPPPSLPLLPRGLLYACIHSVGAAASGCMLRDEAHRWRRWRWSGARYVAGEGEAAGTDTPSASASTAPSAGRGATPDDRLLAAVGPFVANGWRSFALACTTVISAACFCVLTVHSCLHPSPGLRWAGSCTGNEDPLAYGALVLVGLTLAGMGVSELTHTIRHAVGVLVSVFSLVLASLWAVWSSPGPRPPRGILLAAVYVLLLAAGVVLFLKAVERNLFMRVAVTRTLHHEQELTAQRRQQRAEMAQLEASMAATAAQAMERRIGEVMAPLRDAAHGIQQLTTFLAERHQALRARARAAGATAAEDAAQQLLDADDFADVQANAAKLQRILAGWEEAIDEGAAQTAMLDALQEAKRLRDATQRMTAAQGQGAAHQRLDGGRHAHAAGAAARPQGPPPREDSTAAAGGSPVASAGIAALPPDHPYGANRGREASLRIRQQQQSQMLPVTPVVGGEPLPPIRLGHAAAGGGDGDHYEALGDVPDGGPASAEDGVAAGGVGAAFSRRVLNGWHAAAMATPYEAPPERGTATPLARAVSVPSVTAAKIPAWYHQRHPPPTGLQVVPRTQSLPERHTAGAAPLDSAHQPQLPPSLSLPLVQQQVAAPAGVMTVALQPYQAQQQGAASLQHRHDAPADAVADASPEGSTPRPRLVTAAHAGHREGEADAIQVAGIPAGSPSVGAPQWFPAHHGWHRHHGRLLPAHVLDQHQQQQQPIIVSRARSPSTDAGYAASSDMDATTTDHAGTRYALDARGYRRRVHGTTGTPMSTPSGSTHGPVRVPLAWPTVPLSHYHTQWKGVRRGDTRGVAQRHAGAVDHRPACSTLRAHAHGRSVSPHQQYPAPTGSSDASSGSTPWTSSDLSDAGGTRSAPRTAALPWSPADDAGMVLTVAGSESPLAPRRAHRDRGMTRARCRRHRLRGGSPAGGSNSPSSTPSLSPATSVASGTDHVYRETDDGRLMLQWTHDGRLSRLTEAEAERDSPDGDQPTIVTEDLHRHGHHGHRRVDSRFDLACQPHEPAAGALAAGAATIGTSPAGGDLGDAASVVGEGGEYDGTVTSDLVAARLPPIKHAPPFAKHDAAEPDMATPVPALSSSIDSVQGDNDANRHMAAPSSSPADEVVLFRPAHTAASVITGLSHHESEHALPHDGAGSPRKHHHHHHHHGATTGSAHHHHDAHQRHHQHHHHAPHMRPLTLGPHLPGGPHLPPPSLSAASAAPSLVPSSSGSGYPTGTDTGTGTLAGSGFLLPPCTGDPRLDESFPVDYGHYHEYQRRREKERLQQQLLTSRLQGAAGPGSASTRLPPSVPGGSVAGSGSTLRIRSAASGGGSAGHMAGKLHRAPSSVAASLALEPTASISETLGIPPATAPTLVRGKMTDASAVMLGVAVPVNDTPRASPVAAAETPLPLPLPESASRGSAGQSSDAGGDAHPPTLHPAMQQAAATSAATSPATGVASTTAVATGQVATHDVAAAPQASAPGSDLATDTAPPPPQAAAAEPYATGGRHEGAAGQTAISPTAVDQAAGGAGAEPQFHFGLHVLVVDDERINTKIACRYLAQLGCTYEAVSDGDEIVNALVSSSKPFDVILLDIIMKRTNGLEVAKALREQHVEIPLIAATAAYSHKEAPIYRAAGFDRVLQKPFNMRDLAAALAQALGIQIGRGAPLNYSVTL